MGETNDQILSHVVGVLKLCMEYTFRGLSKHSQQALKCNKHKPTALLLCPMPEELLTMYANHTLSNGLRVNPAYVNQKKEDGSIFKSTVGRRSPLSWIIRTYISKLTLRSSSLSSGIATTGSRPSMRWGDASIVRQ